MTSHPAIAVLAYLNDPAPLPASILERLYAWRHHGGGRCVVVDLSGVTGSQVRTLERWRPDVLILDATLLRRRWTAAQLAETLALLDKVQAVPGLRVATPMDEASGPDALERIVLHARVDTVLSCAGADTRAVLYPALGHIRFEPVLPCYRGPGSCEPPHDGRRTIAVGYRGNAVPEALGARAADKTRLAMDLARAARVQGLTADVEIGDHALIRSAAHWRRFLGRTRVAPGAESGQGRIWCLDPADARHGQEIDYFTVSARHIEAAEAGCVQVLMPGRYSCVFQANVHYLAAPADYDHAALAALLERALGDDGRRVAEAARSRVHDPMLAWPAFVGAGLAHVTSRPRAGIAEVAAYGGLRAMEMVRRLRIQLARLRRGRR